MSENPTFQETWAVVEQMGHNKYAGRVTEQTFGGASLLRIDVPEIPERTVERSRFDYSKGVYVTHETIPGRPAFTKFIGVSSIFAITPCTEEVARAAAEQFRTEPVTAVDLPGRVAAIAAAVADNEEDEDLDEDHEDEDDFCAEGPAETGIRPEEVTSNSILPIDPTEEF